LSTRWAAKVTCTASTPSDFERAERPALAVFNSLGLAILDRTDGAEIAFREWRTSYDIIAASPLILGDLARITAPRRIEPSAIRG
jgi:hypothetical protein